MIFLSSTVFDNFVSQESWLTWTPTWSSAVGSGGSVNTITARYQYFGSQILFVVRASITTTGTWASDIRFTLPVAPVQFAAGLTRNISNGAFLQYLLFTSSIAALLDKDNNFPIIAGQALALHGRYRWK